MESNTETVKSKKKKSLVGLHKNPKEKSKEESKESLFEYSPSIESSDIVHIKKKNQLFINGKFQAPHQGGYMASINPATEEKISEIAIADEKDVDKAVQAAQTAHKKWNQLKGWERGRYLFRIARIIQERSRELAVLESIDNGKSIRESRLVDIPQVAAHFFYHAGWADKLEYVMPGKKMKSIGVAAQIIPWNFPLLMAAWKIAPALATGNTVVLKPAETTSLTALLLCEILEEAGLPNGVVNILTGDENTGKILVKHPEVQKIAFTGSTEVGKEIARSVAGKNKKLTLELGGKSAHIVYEDAAIDQAVEGVINGIFFNQGHVCCAGSRLLLEESIKDTFLHKLKKRMERLKLGNPLDKNTDIGAVNSKEQWEKIRFLVEEGIQEKQKYFEPSSIELPKKGFFHKPCFFYDVASSCNINRIEIFGPVLSISSFRTPKEAIEKANNSPYGLAAGIWSEKGSKIYATAKALRAGVIWSNTYNKFDPSSPFGGYNESGFGREGGLHGLLSYLRGT